ncbi:MAG: DUF4255 domain-containing protein [Chloroflexi bacterium]|nr:DUF4255 domain-containing protein [Chloroflexota bacterium]
MIHDVDESLRTLVKRDALNGSRVELAFDAPTREWSARQNGPTVSLYLYDIREDTSRREVAWETQRGSDRIATQHAQPPRRFRLSYLITAWTQRPEDEHRLLSAMLACFLRAPVLPSDVLTGDLTRIPLPVLTTIALPPPSDRSIADVWSALGGELKPSLDLVVTAPMDASVRIPAAPPVLESPRIRVVRPDGTTDEVTGGPGIAAVHRPLSPEDEADQQETVEAGGVGILHVDETPGDGPAAASGSGRKRASKAATEPPEAARLPGRRLIIRGVRRP